MSGYTIINLHSDAAAWAKSAKDALTLTDPEKVKQAWIDVAINSAKITSGMAELVANDPKWAQVFGDRTTLTSIGVSAQRISQDIQATNGFDNVKAGDVLSVVGGISDLAGNRLVKPGPQLAVGLILKGVGTGAGIAENMVGDQTIGQLLDTNTNVLAPVVAPSMFPSKPSATYGVDGVSPLNVPQTTRSGNTQIDTTWLKTADGFQKLETITTLDGSNKPLSRTTAVYQYDNDGTPIKALTVTQDGQGNNTHTGALRPTANGQAWESAPLNVNTPADLGTPRRNSSSYVGNGSDGHSAVIRPGGTLSDLWVLQKNAANGFANDKEFYAAVLASNPDITNVNSIRPGQTVYLPQRMPDGSTTYHYANSTSINSNPTTGEYHMVVPDGSGGTVVYSRTADEFGYTVRQVNTDRWGNETSSYTGYQETLDGEIKPMGMSWQNDKERGSSTFGDGTRTDAVTDKDTGQTNITATDQESGQSKSVAVRPQAMSEAEYQNLMYGSMAGFLNALRGKDKLGEKLACQRSWAGWVLRGSVKGQQLRRRHLQGVGQFADIDQGDVALTAFDVTQVTAGDATVQSRCLLRPATRTA